jgi:hypothetical protein
VVALVEVVFHFPPPAYRDRYPTDNLKLPCVFSMLLDDNIDLASMSKGTIE